MGRGVSAGQAQLPRHVAIIMDGNTRWARHHGLSTNQGHRQGLQALRRTLEHCFKRGVRILSVFAFSSENWRRSQEEVAQLMQLFCETLEKHQHELTEQKISLRVIGDRQGLGAELRELLNEAEQATSNGDYQLVVALNYGGKQDIAHACQTLAQQVAKGVLAPQQIDANLVEQHMALSDLPPPDLLIRTSNERRLSNFMLWQLAYSELYFCPTLWPDFGPAEFDLALADYTSRQRRYGASSKL